MRPPSPCLVHRLLLFLLAAGALPVTAQNFLQPKVITTGNWPAAVYSADVNGDGYPDLIYVDQGATTQASTTHILLNDGKGNFTQSAVVATAGTSLALADMDGNGTVDMVWATAMPPLVNNTSTIGSFIPMVAYGSGAGTFAAPASYGTPVILTPFNPPLSSFRFDHVAVGHFYQTSGPLDVVFEETTQNALYKFSGSSLYSQGIGIPGTGQIAVASLTGSGYNDLVLQAGDTGVFTLPGGPNFKYSSASAPTVFNGLTGIHSFLIQDVNFDGKPDLLAEGANGHIDVYFGNGDGTFQPTSSGGTGPLNGLTGNGGHLIAAADFNHDGLLDALTATPVGISTLLGQGTQYLGLEGIYNAGPGRTSYAIADFNGDGNLDLAVDSPEGIAILFGNPDGSFQTSLAYAAGQPALSGALAKFTSSGHMDAVVSTGATQAQVLLGDGAGAFTAVGGSSPTPSQPSNGAAGLWSTVRAGDFNGDGKLDIAIGADGPAALIPPNSSGTILQLGDGAGNFAAAQPLPILTNGCGSISSPHYGSLQAADLNGDGISDLAVRDQGQLTIFLGVSGKIPTSGSTLIGNTCADVDHAPIVAGSFHATGAMDVVTMLPGEASGNLFAFNAAPLLIEGDLSQAAGGYLQLTTFGQTAAPVLAATFGGTVPVSLGGLGFPAAIGSMAAADLDGDGNLDLVVAYANLAANLAAPAPSAPNYIYLWYGTGGGKFLVSAAHPVNPVVLTTSRNFYQIAVADMNADGIPDLILSDGYVLSVQLGKGDGTFGAETHYLAGPGINGIAVGDLRNKGRNDLIIANGGAVLSNPAANLEQLATNADVNTGGVTVLLNQVTPLLASAATVSASPEPSSFGNDFNIFLAFSTTQPAPTGTVTFSVDGNVTGTATIYGAATPGVTYPAPNTLAAGMHTLTASYSGDSNYQPGVFMGAHMVTTAATINSVVASPEPSVYGNSFTITATTAGPGIFDFFVDSTFVGGVTSSTNTASTVAPGTYATGLHTLSVLWFGLNVKLQQQIIGTHQVTVAPTALSLLLCVDNPGSLFPCGNPLASTPLVSPITFFYGQSLDGIASESSTSLTGSINFYDGTRIFCTLTANLAAGTNTCPTQSGYFNAGSRTVYAMYTGDANDSPSTSNSIQVTVYPDPTTATLTSSLNPAVVGTSVTFTAVLAGNYSTPTGTVNFYDGATLLGGGTLSGTGSATFTTSTLAIGSHPITAVYAGTSNFNPVTSAIVTQVITSAAVPPPAGTGFTFTVTPDPITVGAGATDVLLVTVMGQSSSTPAVALSCSGLPVETTCTFVTPTIAAGGGSTTLQLHVSAPHDCGSTTPYFIGSSEGPASPVPYAFAAVFFFALAGFRRRRNLRGVLLILIALMSLASLSGCGHCTDLGTRPGNYSFTVTATPQGSSTAAAQSITIPLTVTIP